MTPEQPRPPHLWGRRETLTGIGWGVVVASLVAGCGAFVRFLFRRAPIRPPSVFRAGMPSEFPAESVTDRFVKKWRVFIVQHAGRLMAIHARCTHLGCTPRWRARATKFKCPCHGSGFTIEGVNFEGPAPRPLERAKIWLGRDGAVWVDVGVRYPHTRWDSPQAAIVLQPRGEARAGTCEADTETS